MSRNHETRSGFTLTEVLMAMFVMAIGMISLLALFPVAFQSAKWALDNEQVARGAANAQSMTEMPRVAVDNTGPLPVVSSNARSVRNDDLYRPELSNSKMPWSTLAYEATTVPAVATELGNRLGRNTYLVHYDNVTDPTNPVYRWTYNTDISTAPAGTKVVFPPVLVDPLVAENFFFDFSGTTRIPFHVGADSTVLCPFRSNSGLPNISGALLRPNRSVGIPRMSMSQFRLDPDPTGIRKQLELKMSDELTFGTKGQPADGNDKTYPDPAAGPYSRQSRFTWAYMCQWPNYKTPEVCDVTAVVFNSRPELNGLATLPPGEVTYTATATALAPTPLIFSKGLTQASIPLPNAQPMNAKVGDWILDSTFILPGYDPANPAVTAPFLDTAFPPATLINGLQPGLVGGHFYKILDIGAVQTSAGLFFQTITLDRPAKSDGVSATTMSGIADVITKGVGRMPQH